MRRIHNVENSPDIGSVCKRCRKATDMTNTIGRAERSSWVEGVIFKPKAAAGRAGLAEAALPLDPGTWLGLEQADGGWPLLSVLRCCLDSVSYPGTMVLRPP